MVGVGRSCGTGGAIFCARITPISFQTHIALGRVFGILNERERAAFFFIFVILFFSLHCMCGERVVEDSPKDHHPLLFSTFIH